MLTRTFQLEFFDAVLPAGRPPAPGILVAVPGAGKTAVLVHVAFSALAWAVRRGEPGPHRAFVFVVDAMTAHAFAAEWRRLDGGDTCSVVGDAADFDARVFPEGLVVATYQWAYLNSVYLAITSANIVILDEVHRAAADKWKEGWSVVRDASNRVPLRVGATATLSRTDDGVRVLTGDPKHPLYVGPVVCDLNFDDARRAGYVTAVELHECVCPVATGGGADAALLSARKAPYMEHLLAPYLRGESGEVAAVVFVRHPKTAESLAWHLRGDGDDRRCFYLTSDVAPLERSAILKYFNGVSGSSDEERALLARYAGRPRVMFTTVGQEGMNVAACTRVVQFDAVVDSGTFDAQRAGRAARIKTRDVSSDCHVLLTPAENARRIGCRARAYTAELFKTQWISCSDPSRARASVYASETSVAFRALVAAERGERDIEVQGRIDEQRKTAAAAQMAREVARKRQKMERRLMRGRIPAAGGLPA